MSERTKKIILTHSFKGGTGKTVIATNFAYYFMKKGLKTLLIDGDLLAPSLVKIIPPKKKEEEIKTWVDFLEEENEIHEVIYPTFYKNLDVIYSPAPEIGKSFLTEKNTSWWVQALKRSLCIREYWQNDPKFDYDFIIIDNQNGISMNSANNITLSDIGFLILRPVTYGVSGTAHLLREMYATLQDFRKREDYLIWNQIPRVADEERNRYVDKLLGDWDDFFRVGGLEPISRIEYSDELSISMLQYKENELLGTSDTLQKEIERICSEINLGQK